MTETTLYRFLVDLAQQDPGARMFIDSLDDGYRQVSRREFLAEVDRCAALLHEQRIGDGDCIATWLPNWSTACAWQFAASAVGAHVIGVNTRYNVVEIQHILSKARPRLLAMAHDFRNLDLLGRAQQAVAEMTDPQIPVVVPVPGPGQPVPKETTDYDLGAGTASLPQTGSDDADSGDADSGDGGTGLGFAPVGPDPDRLIVAFTTSGSTGLPKLAAHKESAVLWHARSVHARLDFRRDDAMIGALPYSGVFGYSAAMGALIGGASVLMHPVFDADLLLREIEQFRATHYAGADDMLQRLRLAWNQDRRDLSSWRWVGIGDFEGKSRSIAAWMHGQFGTEVVGVYGSSELFALTAFWSARTSDPQIRWGGGGVPVSERIEVRIADPLDDRPVEQGQEGELQFRGPNVVDAYLGDTGEGAKAFTRDGWFHSGDLGTLREDGGFVYVCRMGDVLRLKGFLVDPSEIEKRLAEHPSIHTAKTVGVMGEDGQRAIGYVTLRDDAGPVTPEELRTWCAEALARFKVPSAIEIIEQMPTTAGTNGTKIRAAELRSWAAQRYGAAAH